MNSESAEAKRWFAMKAHEAMEEIDAVIGKPATKKAKTDTTLQFSSSAEELDVSISPFSNNLLSSRQDTGPRLAPSVAL